MFFQLEMHSEVFMGEIMHCLNLPKYFKKKWETKWNKIVKILIILVADWECPW